MQNHLEGTIKVYECSDVQESKFSDQGYFKVSGRMAGITQEWISDLKLESGEHDVKVALSQYKGSLAVRIVSLL